MGKHMTKPKLDVNSSIGKPDFCPICSKFFESTTTFFQMKNHLDYCFRQTQSEGVLCKSLESTNHTNNNKIKSSDLILSKVNKKHVFKKYTPMKNSGKYNYTGKNVINPDYYVSFEKKLEIFRNKIKCMKIDWREGSCNLLLNRENFLFESMKQFKKINIYKELKVNFIGEVSNDAGGIIREWFTLIFKELQSPNRNLFEKQDGNDFNYIVSKNINNNKETLEIFNFIGKSLAKAFLENITINSCFNKIFYKVLLNENVIYNDLVFIDKTLYHSLEKLQKIDNLEELELFFLINYEKEGVIYSEELITNGENEIITINNLNIFIEKRIENLIKNYLPFLNEFREGFLCVINENIINIFNSDELELIINGQPFIDVYDWKSNTYYQGGYSESINVITWFWSILFELSQEELSKFLQFCTGTSRVPIGGFSSLESNRSEISRFCIVNIEYNVKKTNYIIAHTCFNRIDLPRFPSKKLLEEAILFILKNEIFGFGID